MNRDKFYFSLFVIFIFVLSVILVAAAPSFHTSGTTSYLVEDQDPTFEYNFTSNVTNDENVSLTFEFVNITMSPDPGASFSEPADFYWISLDAPTGVMILNSTKDNETGDFNIPVFVHNSEGQGQSEIFYFNVNATNDAPVFVNLENLSFSMEELFETEINVTDEENNVPFNLSISFESCTTAEWSDRNSSDCNLFNSSDYSFNDVTGVLNISFTPLRNDVGSYIINFSVTDNSSLINETASILTNYTVLNNNSLPYFVFVCDDYRNGTEDIEFTCWINATDVDETINLTFEANYSWFLFNASTSSITELCNSTTEYNASVLVNFTATDTEVGNWSVNISVTDTGGLSGDVKINSTEVWFYIENTEDVVVLETIDDLTVYENQTIYVNASDNDLLVPDPNVKDENLTFASNTSWVNVSVDSTSNNETRAKIDIDFDTALENGAGNYIVMINVTDTADNVAERNFTITIVNDASAVWNTSETYEFAIYEGNETYINLTTYVADAEGDGVNFSFTNDSAFPSFSIEAGTGIINLTPVDGDVGAHNITINASDSKLDSFYSFNFTIYNVDDTPGTESPLQSVNATVNETNSEVNTSEDTYTELTLFAQDDDYMIPAIWKVLFYNESLSITTTIEGPNTTLFNFAIDSAFADPLANGNNRTKFDANFTPAKEDVGSYNITLNISDADNLSVLFEFNLTIAAVSHSPSLMALTNHTSRVNESFYYQINASDTEDGSSNIESGNSNFTFSYEFLSGTSIFNETLFNSTTGETNLTFNDTQGGAYNINITVNDSSELSASADFWIYVYDNPSINSPLSTDEFYLMENETYNLDFNVNHSVEDNLTYEFYISDNGADILRYNISYYGNETNLTWEFTPNFTDESYNEPRNLTLFVYPADSSIDNRTDLNATQTWNMTINHTNYPLEFSGSIGGAESFISGGSPQVVSLADYFSDADASDRGNNQTIIFNYTLVNSSSGSITVTIADWVNGTSPSVTLTASADSTASYYITGYEYNLSDDTQIINNISSNNFTIELNITTTRVETPTPSGGGGGSSRKLISLKILVPAPISALKKDSIVIPITLSNEGKTALYGINLTSIVAKNSTLAENISILFDKTYFDSLDIGAKENVTLTIGINTEEQGMYEITINASVKNPVYQDWGKFFLTVREANETEVMEKLLFTEELLAENPECIELREMLEEARELYKIGKNQEALDKSLKTIEACKYAISQAALPSSKISEKNQLYKYLVISILAAILVGFGYYLYKKTRLRRWGT